MNKRIGRALKDCTSALKMMYQYGYSYRASSLAFSTLLSLVPMVSVFVFIMTQARIFTQLNRLARDYVINNFVPTSSQIILTYLDQFSQQAARLPIFSILFLFVTTIFLVITIDNSMNTLWHKENRRKGWLQFLIYPLIVLLIPVFIGALALLSALALHIFSYFPEIKLISFALPLFINMLTLSLLYMATTRVKIYWRDTLLGSFIAALLLEFSKIGFAIYVNQFSNYDAIYGALATIPILLVWLYIFWLIILYGAFIVKIRFQRK